MDKQAKKEILIKLIKLSGLPTSELNTLSLTWEPVDLDKVAEFLLANGVDIVNPFTKMFQNYNKKKSG